jgi:hypothetical protein
MADTKDALIAEIDLARSRLTRDFAALRRDADVPAHLKHSFFSHKTAWIGGAGVAGWLLSRIPARKKKVYVGRKEQKVAKEAAEFGLWFGIAKLLLTAFRPAITTFATQKIADLASRNGAPKK